MLECIFCNIIDGRLPATLVYEDEKIMAWNDINPTAPTHVLIVPRQHVATLNDIGREHYCLIADMATAAINLAKKLGHADHGYRLVMNCNAHGCQSIFHVHMHLLAGRKLKEGMG